MAVAEKWEAPRPRRLRVSLGELIAAACEVTGGEAASVALLLERGPLALRSSKRLKFV
jgi:hypothetical protein